MPGFSPGDRVVLVDGRCATVTATGARGVTVRSVDGQILGPMRETDLSVAVDEDFDRERRRGAQPKPASPG